MEERIPKADNTKASSANRLAIGVDEIDRQHDAIFALIETADRMISADADRREIRDVFERLLRLCGAHFGHEEGMMRAHAYPLQARHTEAHQELLREASRLLVVESAGGGGLRRLLEIFRGWSVVHVVAEDQPLGLFLAGRHTGPTDTPPDATGL